MKVLRRVPVYLAVVASLLVFPAWAPWAALAWILSFGVTLLLGRPAWIYAALPMVVLLLKGQDWTWAFLVLLLLLGVAAARARWLAAERRRSAAALAALLLSWVWMTWAGVDGIRARRRPAFDPGRPIVCMGDSLTAYAYPRELQKLVAAKVVDHGVGGTTSLDGLGELQRTLALKPQLVFIEYGGNDHLQSKVDARDTYANLERMVVELRAAGAEVILFEIPRGFVTHTSLYRRLARERDLEMIPDGVIRWLPLRSPWFPVRLGEPLSDDGLHPNAAGNVHLARAAAAALERVYGPAVRAR